MLGLIVIFLCGITIYGLYASSTKQKLKIARRKKALPKKKVKNARSR